LPIRRTKNCKLFFGEVKLFDLWYQTFFVFGQLKIVRCTYLSVNWAKTSHKIVWQIYIYNTSILHRIVLDQYGFGLSLEQYDVDKTYWTRNSTITIFRHSIA
jgi:hypothetical protein